MRTWAGPTSVEISSGTNADEDADIAADVNVNIRANPLRYRPRSHYPRRAVLAELGDPSVEPRDRPYIPQDGHRHGYGHGHEHRHEHGHGHGDGDGDGYPTQEEDEARLGNVGGHWEGMGSPEYGPSESEGGREEWEAGERLRERNARLDWGDLYDS